VERQEELFKQATALHLKGSINDALEIYDKLLAFDPDNPQVLACMGTAFSQASAFGMAIQLFTKAVKLKPDIWDAWHNLGISYRTMGMIDKAMECYHQELTAPKLTQAEMAQIYGNMSGCYINEGRPERAIELADQGLRYNPASPQLSNHKALALLELGRYQEGFRLYEVRYELPEFHKRDFGKAPRWDGKPIASLAIHGEQGIGDELLFLTQVPAILPRVEHLAIECTPRLLGLLRNSYRDEPKISLYPDHAALSKAFVADAWLGLGSLMLHSWPPIRAVYLKPSRTYFRGERPRIGVSWRGGTLRTHEYHRNAPLECWLPLVKRVKDAGIDLISVQYGPAAEMAKQLGVPHDEANIADLDTLAAMLKSCDLVVSVCNTTIHMCGALGVPCLVLVPSKPAWRYGLSGEDVGASDWYDSVSYIRQTSGESWDSVLARATKYVEAWSKHADHRALSATQRATA
jgi:tetratricopeptide (TPR) repeat protein